MTWSNIFKEYQTQVSPSDRLVFLFSSVLCCLSKADPEGDRGSGPPPPPGKSQVIWVSIGNKQLDPTPLLEKVGPLPPPPPLENVGPPP